MEPDNRLPGLPFRIDLAFIHRVYRTSLVLLFLGALLFWERYGASAALGWMVGSGLNLASLAGLEWTVRRYLTPETRSSRGLAVATFFKMAAAVAVLFLAVLAAERGWISLLWLMAGFVMPHLVIVLKLIGQKVRAATAGDSSARTG